MITHNISQTWVYALLLNQICESIKFSKVSSFEDQWLVLAVMHA